ncbi:MAG: hypothetical protein QM630_00875 [Microbacterium sp.]
MVAPTTVLVALLAGCVSTVDAPADQEPSPAMSSPREVPAFDGNFAAEYREAWEKGSSETVRSILKDEAITDQEWSQVLRSLETCLVENGIEFTVYNPDGSYEVNAAQLSGDVANEYMGECERDSGEAWIGYLYRSQTNNPGNVPASQLLTECLIRNAAVAPSYTEEQYLIDAPDLAFPFIDERGFDIFDRCTADFGYNK